jgi:hypothetical protein
VALTPVVIALRTGLTMWLASATAWGPGQLWQSAGAVALWPLTGAWHGLWWPMWIDLAWLAAWSAFMPLCFVIFRRTLRVSRVRPIHIVRITLYGAVAWPLLVAIFSILIVDVGAMAEYLYADSMFYQWWPSLESWASAGAQVAGVGLIGGWLCLFWHQAIRRYLRLRHAFPTAVAITIVSLLASVIVTGNGEFAWALVANVFGIELA